MTEKELLQKIHSNDDEQEILHDAQTRLNTEMEKPADKRDYDLICELTQRITLLDGSENWVQRKSTKGIRLVQAELEQCYRKKHIRWMQVLAPCACLLVMFNIFSYTVYGMNAFSAVCQMMKGGITFDLMQQEDLPAEGNPYAEEMRRICDEYDMNVLLPSYIPAEVKPHPEIFSEHHPMETNQSIVFNFKKKKTRLKIIIEHFYNMEDYIPMGIASDEHHVTMQTINGTNVYIVKEDKQFNAVFLIGQTQYALCTDGLDYDECQRVLDSFFT